MPRARYRVEKLKDLVGLHLLGIGPETVEREYCQEGERSHRVQVLEFWATRLFRWQNSLISRASSGLSLLVNFSGCGYDLLLAEFCGNRPGISAK